MKKSNSQPFRILVATDVHLGFKQSHQIRGNDSFVAFRQILKYCDQISPDILLLGGDLFDTVNPSQACIYTCLKMLQQSVFGERSIDFNLKSPTTTANFLSENLNIKLPIFTIHGNHDVPMQYGKSICDLLQACNYVNYFGNFPNSNQVHLKPLVFEKGDTIVSIYGLGYIHPFRLSRLFKDKKITFEQPQENSYNIIVIHQNRFKGKTLGVDYQECLHPDQLPQWIDLIIWGHQHQSIPQFIIQQGRKTYQPGSTIATSLIPGESLKKHIGLLEIKGRDCQLTPCFLNDSYRPIINIDIDLEQLVDVRKDELTEIIVKRVEEDMEREMRRIIKEEDRSLQLPLVRVKLETTEKYQPKLIELEKHFLKSVANKSDVFKAKKKKLKEEKHMLVNAVASSGKKVAFQVEQFHDQQSQLRSKLKKNLNSYPFLIEKSAQIFEIMQIQLQKIGGDAKHIKSFNRLIEQSSLNLREAGIQQLKSFNQVMNKKHTMATKIQRQIIQRNLSFNDWSQEYDQKVEKETENLIAPSEYESMWDTRMKKIDNLTLEAMMGDERYRRKEEANRHNRQNIKEEALQESVEFKRGEVMNKSHIHDHSHVHMSDDEFEEEKCCPKEGVEFNEDSERNFNEIFDVVRNESNRNKRGRPPKKEGKKGSKVEIKEEERKRGKKGSKGRKFI